MKRVIDVLGTAFVFLMALGFLIFLDVQAAVTLYWPMLLIYILLWLGINILQLAARPWPYAFTMFLIWLAAGTAVYMTDWNSRKPFLRQYQQIKVGMDESEVADIMAHYQPYVHRAAETDALFYRHTDAGWGDADIVVIEFDHGRVAHTQFLPD
ncbi:MAG: hypothetical protein KDE51_19845 [Anaerolineales bacterium]|nr:hypothetical protein [Anaerolineales bacterium]